MEDAKKHAIAFRNHFSDLKALLQSCNFDTSGSPVDKLCTGEHTIDDADIDSLVRSIAPLFSKVQDFNSELNTFHNYLMSKRG